MRTLVAAGLLFALAPGCISNEISGLGGDGDSDGDGGDGSGSSNEPTPRVQATMDKSMVMTELGKTENLAVTITAMDGFSGVVPITPVVLDGTTPVTGWTVTPSTATVELAPDGSATVSLAVTIPSDSMALAPTLKVDLGGSAPMSITSAFNVANRIVITIPQGTGTGSPHAGLPLGQPLRIRQGTMVVFHNGDSIQHVIHASGGINHQNTTLGMPNTDYMVTPNADSTWYCHNHEGAGQSRAINLP